MKKHSSNMAYLFITICTLVGMLGGCAAMDANANDKPTQSKTESVANKKDDFSIDITSDNIQLVVWESKDGPDEWIKKAGDAFTKKYPNITITYENVEINDIVTTLSDKSVRKPDLFGAAHDKLGELVENNYVEPTADSERVCDCALRVCTSALTYDNILYGYPTSAETYALVYNKALISQQNVPKSWDEMLDYCKSFNQANTGKYGFIMDTSTMYYNSLFTTADGNRLFGTNGTDTSTSYMNTSTAIKGMTFLQKLRQVVDLSAKELAETSDGLFMSGKAAMYVTGPWNIGNFKNAGIDFGVTTLPSLDGETTPSVTFSGTRGMFVYKNSKHKNEAALFAHFLLSEEMQQLRYRLTGALPSINITVDSEQALGFIKQLDYSYPMPSVPQMSAFWEYGTQASENIWDGNNVKTELDLLEKRIMQSVAGIPETTESETDEILESEN